jgi:hypothetical protein
MRNSQPIESTAGFSLEDSALKQDRNFDVLSQNFKSYQVTNDYTFTTRDKVESLRVDATSKNITVTLLPPVGQQRRRITKVDNSTHTVTITAGSYLINLQPTHVLVYQFDQIEIEPTGNGWVVISPVLGFIPGYVDVRWFGAVGDGTTDDTTAIQAAINSLSSTGGVVVFPISSGKYIVNSTITLLPNIHITGVGRYVPIIRFTGGNSTLFNFLGVSEAQSLNVEISHLQLESATTITGTCIRCRNFFNITLTGVIVSNFASGIWCDWGIGVYLEHCVITSNTRGLVLGGGTGGIRGGTFATSDFMDTVSILTSGFSQNKIDINDM